MTPKTIAVLGAGERGRMFGDLVAGQSHSGRVVAVADKREDYRQSFAATHHIDAGNVFSTWQEFLAKPKLCDAVVICLIDREHAGAAVGCLQRGYDILLEKPMATTLADCRAIEQAQRSSGRIVAVCHSLRYQKGFRMVKDMLDAGAVGRIMTLDLIEQVAFWHQAHSFVRGNWGNSMRSTFMLLAKSCHDVDYICWLANRPCLRTSSFGNLSYFRRENAPAGSTERCADPCPVESTCAYSAIRQYVDTNRQNWPASMVSLDHSREAHMQALREGPYGRCVWKCDNDVVDHQVVNFQFADDLTATFTMTAFTHGGGRILRVNGTEGELAFDEMSITVKTFANNNVQTTKIGHEPGGHGGGDNRVVREWLTALHSRDDRALVANAQESLKTHTVVFAAEMSRREGRMVEVGGM